MVKSLKREINLLFLTIYGVGIIVGAGIYALIGKAAGITGNSVWLSFLFGAIMASFTAMSYAELSSMFPKSASEYHYVKNAFESKVFGNFVSSETLTISSNPKNAKNIKALPDNTPPIPEGVSK